MNAQVFFDHDTDAWYWCETDTVAEDAVRIGEPHGPFATAFEAGRDARAAMIAAGPIQ